jgi:uncharacterized protein GlcG (DUF336 family)
VRQIQGVYEKASEKIPSKLVSRDNSKVDLALADIYAEAQAAGNRLPFGLGVVDEKGRVVAVRTPSPDSPFGVKGKGIDQDYSKYKVFAKALSGGRLSMGRLYIENTSFLVVCGPLRQKGKVVGALGIKMSEDLVRERAGVPVEEFLKININF